MESSNYDYGSIDWRLINVIINSDNFKELSCDQICSYTPVYKQNIVLPENVIKVREEERQIFVKQELEILKKRYPEVSKQTLKNSANLCSRHYSDVEANIDRDICVIKVIKDDVQYKETYKNVLNDLKLHLKEYNDTNRNITYYPNSYSEFRVLPLVIGQFQRHMENSNNPILTWGASRLALQELLNMEKQIKKNKVISY